MTAKTLEPLHWPISESSTVKDAYHDGKEDARSYSGDSSYFPEELNVVKAQRIVPAKGEKNWIPVSNLAPSSGQAWSIQDSDCLYGLSQWSEGYFGVNESGNIIVRPNGDAGGGIDLHEVVESLVSRGVRTPLILRFPEIIGDRIGKLNGAFLAAARRFDYQTHQGLAPYRGVFPIKCNHDRNVIHAALESGRPWNFGLEVGSKAELLLATAAMAEVGALSSASAAHVKQKRGKAGNGPSINESPLLICNGYKDTEYIEMAAQISQLGASVVLVMEQPSEVASVANASRVVHCDTLMLGLRARLGFVHDGHWGGTSGEGSKFGLGCGQLCSALEMLRTHGLLSRLCLLHFHVGSQMSTLRQVTDAVSEGAHLYAELVKMGASNMCYLDVGGGLAIDYDGSSSSAHTSRAYSLESYCHAVVKAVKDVMTLREVPLPVIVSESGRALASHHAVVVFDVLDGGHGVTRKHALLNAEHQTEHSEAIPVTSNTSASSTCDLPGLGQEAENSSNNCPVVSETILAVHSSPRARHAPLPASPATAALHSPLARCRLGSTDLGSHGSYWATGGDDHAQPGAFLMSNLQRILSTLCADSRSLQIALRDTAYLKAKVLCAFTEGVMSLRERSTAEHLVGCIEDRARVIVLESGLGHAFGFMENTDGTLTSDFTGLSVRAPPQTLHVNLSVFRSCIDSWAIGHVFPILPLHRLDEKPEVDAILADLTCDSDGKIDAFINPKGGPPLKTLPVHAPKVDGPDGPYHLALFLAGVYQESMGSAHNMFGTMNAATIRQHGGMTDSTPLQGRTTTEFRDDFKIMSNFQIVEVRAGENVSEVLERAGHDVKIVLKMLQSAAASAAASNMLPIEEAESVLTHLFSKMQGYTYLR